MSQNPDYTAGIIVIGDEILKGQVADTNTHFMTKHLFAWGVKVKKISVVPDDIDAIAREVSEFSSKYTYVITSGGIGPTHDDLTFESVGQAFDEQIEPNPHLVELCKKYFGTDDLNSPKLKMAKVPKSARLIYGEDKSTGKKTKYPLVNVRNTYMFPGVPSILEHAFPLLKDHFKNPDVQIYTKEIYVQLDEISITPILNEADAKFKRQVTLGSYPDFINSTGSDVIKLHMFSNKNGGITGYDSTCARTNSVKLQTGSVPRTSSVMYSASSATSISQGRGAKGEMDLSLFWSSLPGIPKKMKWPVKVKEWSPKVLVYCRADDAYFSVQMEQLIPFPGPIEKYQDLGIASLRRQKKTLKAFNEDIEWAVDSMENIEKSERRHEDEVDKVSDDGKVYSDEDGSHQVEDRKDCSDEGEVSLNCSDDSLRDPSFKLDSDTEMFPFLNKHRISIDKNNNENTNISDIDEIGETDLDELVSLSLKATDLDDLERESLKATDLDELERENMKATDLDELVSVSLKATYLDELERESLKATDLDELERESMKATDLDELVSVSLKATYLDELERESLKATDGGKREKESVLIEIYELKHDHQTPSEDRKVCPDGDEVSLDEYDVCSDDSFRDPSFKLDSDMEADNCVSDSDSNTDRSEVFPFLNKHKMSIDHNNNKNTNISDIDELGSVSLKATDSGKVDRISQKATDGIEEGKESVPSDIEESKHDHETPNEERIIRDRKMPQIFIRKLSHSDVDAQGNKKKTSRVYDNYNCCLICKKMKSNFRKHIITHKTNAEVKRILQLKLLSGRQKEIERRLLLLRNAGNHRHNMSVLQAKEGELLISRRQEQFNHQDYGPCSKCFEWIKMGDSAVRHQKSCPVGLSVQLTKGDMVVRSNVIKGLISMAACPGLINNVYPIMTRDKYTDLAQRDPVIVALGNYAYRQAINNKQKRKYITSSRMRGAARLLGHLKDQHGSSMQMRDFFDTDYFDDVVSAALKCASPDIDDEEDLKHPSAAKKAGHDILQMADICYTMYLREKNKELMEEVEAFMSLLKKEWENKVSKLANKLLRQRRMANTSKLPDPADLQKLALHLREKLQDPTRKSYRDVAESSLCRLLLYNKRRSGELEQMLIENYDRRSVNMDESEESLIGADLTELERKLLVSQEIIKIEGKGEQTVPVLVPPDTLESLTYIRDEKVRSEANVKKDNPYLFATTGDGSLRAYDCIKKLCTEVGVSAPDRITSVQIRKYFATMTQVIGLKDHELGYMCKHLGHTMNVHKLHYRASSGYIERINIGKLMLIQDFNAANRFKGCSLEDIKVEDILKVADSSVETSDGTFDNIERIAHPVVETLSKKNSVSVEILSKKKPKKSNRQKWSIEEETELRELFKTNLDSCICPSRRELGVAVLKSRENNGVIFKRSLDNIKKKVWNMYRKQ